MVREHMRAAVAATPDCTLRATVFSRSFDYRKPAGSFAAEVLVSLSPAAPSPAGAPLRVKSFEFQRPLPHIKHVGTFPLFHYRRHAIAGRLRRRLVRRCRRRDLGRLGLECRFLGRGAGWSGRRPRPCGARPSSCCRQVWSIPGWRRSYAQVRSPDLGGFKAAFASNASGIQPIASIDETGFGQAPEWRRAAEGP